MAKSKSGQFEHIGESIKRLFSGTRSRAQPAPIQSAKRAGRSAQPTRRRPSGADGNGAVEDRLRKLLANKEVVSAGRLQVLGLDAIRAQLGDRWERVRDRVSAIVDRTIKERLTPSDICNRCGDFVYVIVFGELSAQEAEVKSALIAEEIRQRVLGDEISGDQISVNSVVADVDGQTVTKEVNLLDSLEFLLKNAEATLAADDIGHGSSTSDSSAGPASRSDHHGKQEGPENGQTASDAVAEPNAPRQELKFLYGPVWDVKRSAILSYQCLFADEVTGQVIPADCNPLDESARRARSIERDRLVLEKTVETLLALLSHGQRLLVVCQVNFESFAWLNNRRAYLDSCRKIPEEIRQNIVFELKDAPDGVPQLRIMEIVSALKPFCRGLQWEVDLQRTRFDNLIGSGIKGIGVDLQYHSHPEPVLMRMMDAFAISAKRAGFESFLHGVPSTSLATYAVCAGFDYVSGHAVHPSVRELEHAYRFQASNLFSHLTLN